MNYISIEGKVLQNNLTYREYLNLLINELAETNPDYLDEKKRKKFDTKKLNLQRSTRIIRTYKISEELKEEIKKIKEPQTWMVITENWCGDSAQNLPYIYRFSEENEKIDLKIILRDSNPEIIDMYLTHGTRSIPILVAFDGSGNELFRWGPRPKVLQDLFNQWKSYGIVKPELYEKLHLWYAKNKGQALESEFLNILAGVEQTES